MHIAGTVIAYSGGAPGCLNRPGHGSEISSSDFETGVFVDSACTKSAPKPFRYSPGSLDGVMFLCYLRSSASTQTAAGLMLYPFSSDVSDSLSVVDGGRLDVLPGARQV